MAKKDKKDDKACLETGGKKKGVSGVITYARRPCPAPCPCPPEPDCCSPTCPDQCPPQCPQECPPECPPCPPKVTRKDGPFGGRVICPNVMASNTKDCPKPSTCDREPKCEEECVPATCKPKTCGEGGRKPRGACDKMVAVEEEKGDAKEKATEVKETKPVKKHKLCSVIEDNDDIIPLVTEDPNKRLFSTSGNGESNGSDTDKDNLSERRRIKEESVKKKLSELAEKAENERKQALKKMGGIKKEGLEQLDTLKNKIEIGLQQKKKSLKAVLSNLAKGNIKPAISKVIPDKPTTKKSDLRENYFEGFKEKDGDGDGDKPGGKVSFIQLKDKFQFLQNKPDVRQVIDDLKRKLQTIDWKSFKNKLDYKDPIGSVSGIMSSGGPSRPMKFPYTYSAKIAQFPMKFYLQKQWIWRYYAVSIAACVPVFWYIHKLSNSPGNVAKWAEIKRKEALEGHH